MRELSLNVLDIAQNSVSANASLIEIELKESTETNELLIGIYDNGKGMTEEQLSSVRDPFFTTRTTRKVGMGIPLFKMAAEMTGGHLEIESEVGVGTKVRAFFRTDHLDFVPVGDMASTMVTLITMNEHIDFLYTRSSDDRVFTLDTRSLKEILGGVPFSEPSISAWLRDFITENTKLITEV
ncbi:MAG: ATP-binding protein [Ruminococcaceae bacterium]|nr:ATP-binding protein [Oscillospiraceae bacterium]